MPSGTLVYWDIFDIPRLNKRAYTVSRLGVSKTPLYTVVRERIKMETKHANYFEGILQLRDVDNEVVDFAVNEIGKIEDAFISKLKKVTNGFDLYISRQRALRSLGNKLQSRFGGQIVVSKKLHTRSRMSGKELFRVNVLFRMPKFKKGDIIEYKGDKIKVISIQKKVFAKDIKTGKKLNISFKDLFR